MSLAFFWLCLGVLARGLGGGLLGWLVCRKPASSERRPYVLRKQESLKDVWNVDPEED